MHLPTAIVDQIIPRLNGRAPQQVRVLVGMSGGVDSSVAALVLKALGCRVEGAFMNNWEEHPGSEYCDTLNSWMDAQQVADHLGVVLHQLRFHKEYQQRVFDHFLDQYARGLTPNPDILCNREIKFRVFLDTALQQDIDFIATGHYARIINDEPRIRLLRGIDAQKDQSYFLHAVAAERLACTLMPLGGIAKHEVRALAAQAGLINHAKADSTGLCFIGERPFRAFLQRYLPTHPGDIVNLDDGVVLGQHMGLMYYTIGQRKGLDVGGVRNYPDAAWYVAAKDRAHNRLIVVPHKDHPALFACTLHCTELHWLDTPPAQCSAQVRYRQQAETCTLHQLATDRWQVDFAQPQRAIAPGQYAVFYRDAVCLGGGVIERVVDAPDFA